MHCALCIARLPEGDAASLFVAASDGADIAPLHNRRDALRAGRRNVFLLINDDPARLADAEDRLNDLEKQLRTLDEEITRITSRSPFADLAGIGTSELGGIPLPSLCAEQSWTSS